MPGEKITGYPTTATIADTDLFDLSTDILGTPVSKAISYADLLSEIETDILVDNIYTVDGSLGGNRVITTAGFSLTLDSTIDHYILDNGDFGTGAQTTGKFYWNESAGILEIYSDDSGTYVGNSISNSITGIKNSIFGNTAGRDLLAGEQNAFYGSLAGASTTSGSKNVFIGEDSGHASISGSNNTYIGNESGGLSIGSGNIFIGFGSGINELGSNLLYISNSSTSTPLIKGDFSTGNLLFDAGNLDWNSADLKLKVGLVEIYAGTTESTVIGELAGNGAFTGTRNIMMGYASGNGLTTGSFNAFFGYSSGLLNSTGGFNTYIGYQAGQNSNGSTNTFIGNATGYLSNCSTGTFVGAIAGVVTTGVNNVFVGFDSARDNTSGANNTFIGTQTGVGNVTGSNSVFIGYQAGFAELTSNKLYISNSSTATPLIYGDFSTGKVTINNVLNLLGLASAPTGAAGDIYYDSTTNKHRGFDGSIWNDFY